MVNSDLREYSETLNTFNGFAGSNETAGNVSLDFYIRTIKYRDFLGKWL
jgi:hypothetical protein